MWATSQGKYAKRPGSVQLGAFGVGVLPGKIDHYIFYETLDSPPLIWLVASVLNASSSLYEVWAVRLDGSGTPASLGTLRNINQSTKPHEFVVSRGKCFIKGYPSGSNDKLGTVIFDGSTNTTTFWGLLGPTTAAQLSGSVSGGVFTASGWASSTFPITVNLGWSYTYTYKTITGHESCRAPLQTNQSIVPSNTGAFTNSCPKMTLVGHSDTVNVPTVVVYRSTDGGGSFYRLEEVSNPGTSFTYEDRHFPDGNAVPAQPIPDTSLDTTLVAPSLTLNNPPPSVAAANTAWTTLNTNLSSTATTAVLNSSYNGGVLTTPPLPATITIDNEQLLVTSYVTNSSVAYVNRAQNNTTGIFHSTGVTVRLTPTVGNDPVAASTPIAYYASRFWYAIGSVLFYSGQEEIGAGIPEESWPSGLLGNFYRFNFPIVNLWSTSEALYIFCTEETYWLRGSTRDTFQLQKLFADIGAKRGHPRAVCAADKAVVWLTHDSRLCMARGYTRDFISDQLGTDIKTAVVSNSGAIHLARYAEFEKDLIVLLSVTSNLASCQQWIYDFNQAGGSGMWSVPWSQPVTAVAAGQPFDTSDLTRKLTWAASNGNAANCYVTTDMTTTSTVQDFVPGIGATNYAANFSVGLVRNPSGNHVNERREPGLTSVLHAVKLDRASFAGDTDPYLNFYFDNLTGSNGTACTSAETPARRQQSVGYATLWYYSGAQQACERVGVQLYKSAVNERWENQILAYIWNPDRGA